jgi:hypothetical protein
MGPIVIGEKALLCPRAIVCSLISCVLGTGRKHVGTAARARERRFGVSWLLFGIILLVVFLSNYVWVLF